MNLTNSALIIIDLQAGIRKIAGKAQPYSFEEVAENNKILMEIFSAADAPIYLVSVQPKQFPKPARAAFGKLYLEDEGKKYAQTRILVKTGPSAFTQSDYGLETELKSLGVEKIFITGISTSNGVIKTARDGKAVGFEVFLVEDGCADRTLEGHNQTIQEDILEIGKVVTLKDFADDE